MLRCLTIVRIISAAGASVCISSVAHGAYVPVDLSTYVDTSFGNLINASTNQYPTGLNNLGSNLTGVPFDIANAGPVLGGIAGNTTYGLNYWGGFLGANNTNGGDDHGTTLQITGLNITDVTTAYTLVNSTFGSLPDFPTTIKFIDNLGGALSFDLFEGTQVRDYNDDGFINTIAAPTTNWFNNGGAADGSSAQQRLDQQTYDLSSLSGNIVEVDVTSNPVCPALDNNGGCINGGSLGGEDTIFAGLTFLTEPPTGVPEPATLALLSLGLAGLGFSRRKQ